MPSETIETQEERSLGPGSTDTLLAGVVLVFSTGKPGLVPVRLDGGSVELGRESVSRLLADDDRVSRRHVRFAFDGEAWAISDLGSRNGVHVDGERVPEGRELRAAAPRVVRMGRTLMLPVRDVRPFETVVDEDTKAAVVGPTLRAAWRKIERAAEYGDALLVVGESGAGKELAARVFHAAATPSGPFVAVNCAAIPEGLAERLLFGAKKGAYSGATEDADGYLQSADGGTLFLDEIAELDLPVQGKLLRVLETKEVMMLGSSRARKVSVRVCSATHKDLRAEVQAGRFREDLFFRVGRPEIALPPLRERLEEIPWHIAAEVAGLRGALEIHVSLVEECLRRHWPGNVRELRAEVRRAAHDALGEDASVVEAKHLGERAGLAFDGELSPPGASQPPPAAPAPATATVTREAVEEALRKAQGNVTQSAKALGMHRTQLRRWLSKNGVDARSFEAPGTENDG